MANNYVLNTAAGVLELIIILEVNRMVIFEELGHIKIWHSDVDVKRIYKKIK
jgi:hypothetical protein